jgi:hypothetical protein
MVTHPSADVAVPADDTIRNPRVIPDHCVAHHDTTLQSHTCTDLYAGANNNVGSENSSRVNLGRLARQLATHIGMLVTHRINKNIAPVNPFVLRRVGE